MALAPIGLPKAQPVVRTIDVRKDRVLRITTHQPCENCEAKGTRFVVCKRASERKARRRRLCEKCKSRWARYKRLEVLPPAVNDGQQKAIEQLYAEGKGASAIARELGIERMRVHRRILKIRASAR